MHAYFLLTSLPIIAVQKLIKLIRTDTAESNINLHIFLQTTAKVYTVKSRIQYAHLYNTHPKLSQVNCGKTLV